VRFHSTCAQQAAEDVRFLNGDRNSLAIHRVQRTDRVADGKQTAWTPIQAPEMTPLAPRESITCDLAERLCTFHCLGYAGRTELSRVGQEFIFICRRRIIASADEEELIAVVLHWQKICRVHAFRSLRKRNHRLKFAQGPVRKSKEPRRVANI